MVGLLKNGLYAGLAAAAMLWAGNASAVTFAGTYTVSPLHNGQSGGTGLGVSGIAPLNFSASPTVVSNLFTISITDAIDNVDDTTANSIGVNFAFTLPSNGIGTVSGSTTGVLSVNPPGPNNTVPGYLQVTWSNSPIVINFGGGVTLQIALANLTINCTGQNLTCAPGSHEVWTGQYDWRGHKIYETVYDYVSGNVGATFSYSVAPGEATGDVPLPAGLPLLASGVAFVGWVGRTRARRRTAN